MQVQHRPNSLFASSEDANLKTPTKAGEKTILGGDSQMFLTLLVAQLKNQNPLDPADPSQFVNQLVQMNQMENSTNMLKEIKGQTKAMGSLQNVMATGQIGHRAWVRADRFEAGQDNLQGEVNLDVPSDSITVNVADLSGQVVKSAKVATHGNQTVSFSDALKSMHLPAGRYQIQVADAEDRPQTVYLSSVVDNVRFNPFGQASLNLKGLGTFAMADITGVGQL